MNCRSEFESRWEALAHMPGRVTYRKGEVTAFALASSRVWSVLPSPQAGISHRSLLHVFQLALYSLADTECSGPRLWQPMSESSEVGPQWNHWPKQSSSSMTRVASAACTGSTSTRACCHHSPAVPFLAPRGDPEWKKPTVGDRLGLEIVHCDPDGGDYGGHFIMYRTGDDDETWSHVTLSAPSQGLPLETE